MPRFHRFKEEAILMGKLRQLIETFGTTEFCIKDIESVGGTERGLVSEGAFWNDQTALAETMCSLKDKRIVLFSDDLYTTPQKGFLNRYLKFKIVPENIIGLRNFQTPVDIFLRTIDYLINELNGDFNVVNEHLRNAEYTLADKSKSDYSEVGHYCQLAYEDFLQICCEKLEIDTEDIENNSKTTNKFKRIVNKLKEPNPDGKEILLLEAIGHFRGCSSDFNEKVEHRSKEQNSSFSDAEKSFLYTYLVIKEISVFIQKRYELSTDQFNDLKTLSLSEGTKSERLNASDI